MGYALPAVMVKAVMLKSWPAAKLVLSTMRSPPPPEALTVPWAWHVVPSLA
jgi:hypothetical protein